MGLEQIASLIATSQGGYSPQHQNNFTLEIYGVDRFETLAIAIATTSLPTISAGDVAIPTGNGQVYVAGRTSFSGGEMRIRDYIDRDVQGILAYWMATVAPAILSGTDDRVGVPSDYKKEGDIILYAPNGTGLRMWHLIGVWPQEVAFGELDRGGGDIVQCRVSLRYDRAIYLGKTQGYEGSIGL